MLMGEGGTLTTEAYMGTVANKVETRRPVAETADVRFSWLKMRRAGLPRMGSGISASEALHSCHPFRASGEVAPR